MNEGKSLKEKEKYKCQRMREFSRLYEGMRTERIVEQK